MKPSYINMNVRAQCPDCGGALVMFEFRDSSHEFGSVQIEDYHSYKGRQFTKVIYRLMRCGGCGRGGLAKLHDSGQLKDAILESFYPVSIERARLPAGVPDGIVSEFREAELCASFEAWRGASALLRSALEKVLSANGYVEGKLQQRIDMAAQDGVITEPRRKRAHDEVRDLGNDVLHEEWREVSQEEVESSHKYVQRIIEDFYDDRASVEANLSVKGRIRVEQGAGATTVLKADQ